MEYTRFIDRVPTAKTAETFKNAQDLYIPPHMKQHLQHCTVLKVWKNDLKTGKLVLHDHDNPVSPIMAIDDIKIKVYSRTLMLIYTNPFFDFP